MNKGLISYEECSDGNNQILDLNQTMSSIISCNFLAKNHNFYIKFKENTPEKVMTFHNLRSKVNGINIISFSFPLNKTRDSKLAKRDFYFIVYEDNLAMKGKIFKGRPKKIYSYEQRNELYIGEMLCGKKKGFGEFKSPNFHYLGMFLNDKRSGEGKLLKNKIKYKGNFKENELHGQIIRKQGNRKTLVKFQNGFMIEDDKTNQSDKSLYEENSRNPPAFTFKIAVKLSNQQTQALKNVRSISLANKSFDCNSSRYLIEKFENFLYLKTRKTNKNLFPICNSWLIHELSSKNSEICDEDHKKTYYFKNGEIFKGMTRKNKFHGFGIYRYSDGKSYHGEFHKGERHGLGCIFNGSEKLIQGTWSNDKLNGIVRIFLHSKTLKCVYSDGILVQILSVVLE